MRWALVLTSLFAATRGLNVWLWQIPQVSFVQNDISYYGFWVWCLLGDGSGNPQCAAALAGPGVMTEYPLPAVWFLQLLYTLGGGPPWTPLLVGIMGVGIVLAAVLLSRGHRRLAFYGGTALILLTLAVWFGAALPYRSGAFSSWMPVFALSMLLLDAVVAVMLFRHGSVGATTSGSCSSGPAAP